MQATIATTETKCVCPLGGACARRGGIVLPSSHHKRCQAGQGAALDRFYAKEPSNKTNEVSKKARTQRKAARAALVREAVGTALKARIEALVTIKTGKGCGCNNLAAEMDLWGIAGCCSRREHIIDHLVKNRDVLATSLNACGWLGHAAGLAVSVLPEIMLRAGAGWLLDQAIEDVRAQPKPARKIRRGSKIQKGSRAVYTGWRSEADGPAIAYGPFVSSVRHLTYFVYPRSLESWQWNLQQLAKRWPLFNGKRILGIAFDHASATPAEVTQYAASLGMTFDHVLTRPNNTRLRETVLFVPMVQLLHPESAGANEVVFSMHAKGQKYDDPKHTRDWCDLMYTALLDDWVGVYDALRTSLMVGSFREYGLLGKWHNWAYSGTFFAWRLAEIGKRNWSDVDQWFAGTESWPGKLCDPRETACLFLNDSRRLYDREYWESTVWPEWAKYREEHRI